MGQCEKMGLSELMGKHLKTLDVIYAVSLMGQGGLGGGNVNLMWQGELAWAS